MVEHIIVALVVLAAALYSAWMLMPAGTRRRAASGLASLARGCGLGEQQSQRLRATLSTQASCGQCAGCKGCAKPALESTNLAGPASDERDKVQPRDR
ncbi:MAG TPA: hypothetical protein VN649_17590 [Ramlibacter sp.]|nr:hypothetical protein [Ramlibacter sp.]